jgi:hypothetical protein
VAQAVDNTLQHSLALLGNPHGAAAAALAAAWPGDGGVAVPMQPPPVCTCAPSAAPDAAARARVAALEARLRALEAETSVARQQAAEVQALCRTLEDQTARLSLIVARNALLEDIDDSPPRHRSEATPESLRGEDSASGSRRRPRDDDGDDAGC